MTTSGTITMTMREVDRLRTIQSLVDGLLMPWQAAERLHLSRRQVERLTVRYRSQGASGLLSRHRGHPSNYQLADGVAERALNLIRNWYPDFGPTLACEKLHECHGITLSKETVRHLMTEAGLWIPRRQRPPKIYQPRARRACLGELVQIDGSEHPWFEGRAPQCTLLVDVDDATSRLMALHFTATESTFGYFEATRGYLERYGKPVAFYSDKASVFRPTHTQTGERGVTHFGRAMYELNIDTWCANSSSAKGRVERAHLTLQDRLVKELRLRGISTIDAANAYAPAFIASYNAHFAKPPKSTFDAHRPLRNDEDLDTLLTWRELRRVTKSLTVQYDRVMYLLADTPANRKLIHRYIDVWEYPDGRIEVRANGTALPCVPYDRLSAIDQGAVIEHKRLGHALQVAQALQAQRDDRRASGSPSRTTAAGTPALEAWMAATERITMTMRELDRFKVIQDVADGRLKPWRAAERLRLTSSVYPAISIASEHFSPRVGTSAPTRTSRTQQRATNIESRPHVLSFIEPLRFHRSFMPVPSSCRSRRSRRCFTSCWQSWRRARRFRNTEWRILTLRT